MQRCPSSKPRNAATPFDMFATNVPPSSVTSEKETLRNWSSSSLKSIVWGESCEEAQQKSPSEENHGTRG